MTTDGTGTQITNGEITDAVVIGDRSMVAETVARTIFPQNIYHCVGIVVGTTGNEYDHRRRRVRLPLSLRPLLRQTIRKNTDYRYLGRPNPHSVHWDEVKEGTAEAGAGTEAETEDVGKTTGFMAHATRTPIQIVTIVHTIIGVETPANSCVGLTGTEEVEETTATTALIVNVHEEGITIALYHPAP